MSEYSGLRSASESEPTCAFESQSFTGVAAKRALGKKLRPADEQAAVNECERVAWAISKQLRERIKALRLSRPAVIRRCVGIDEAEPLAARDEYRYLRVFKGDALPDAAQLAALVDALALPLYEMLEGVDPERLELLRQFRALKRATGIAADLALP